MQLFFNTPAAVSYGILRYSKWDYVRSGLLRNLETTKKYYHSRIFSVKSNHFLVRLINTINVSHNFQIERFYDIVDSKAATIAAAMRMTTAMQKGSLYNGIFYGPGCTEVIMMNTETFDPYESYKNWRDISPVTVVYHPRSDLNLMLPNGKNTGNETGIAIIAVNIPLFAIQYRAFAEEQMQMNNDDNTGLQTVAHFVHRFVLPNMLDSHLDIAIFNRLSRIINGAPMGEASRTHPFVLVDYAPQVNAVHENLVQDLSTRSMDYKAVMQTIPAIVKQNMEQVMTLPENPPTRQVLWAEVLARIDVLNTIINLPDKDSIEKNRSVLGYFAREFKHYQQDRAISVALPRDIYLDTFSEMQQIASMVGLKLDTN